MRYENKSNLERNPILDKYDKIIDIKENPVETQYEKRLNLKDRLMQARYECKKRLENESFRPQYNQRESINEISNYALNEKDFKSELIKTKDENTKLYRIIDELKIEKDNCEKLYQ